MKIQFKLSILTIALVVLSSCSKAPKVIDYGNDGCHFCKMTIVDQIYGAELITDKGKTFKFDAIECMLDYMDDNSGIKTSGLYINYYEMPMEFISAEEATFLISKNLPSPMGANLTAFKHKETASKIKEEKGGDLYTWESLKAHFN